MPKHTKSERKKNRPKPPTREQVPEPKPSGPGFPRKPKPPKKRKPRRKK